MPAIVRFWRQRSTGAAAIALIGAFVPLAAAAQAPTADRIDANERQINNMESELQQLKRELRESRREAARSREQLRQAHEAASRARQDTARAVSAESHATQAAAQAQAVVAAAPPKPQPHVVQTRGNRFGLESADGRNSIYLTGRLHFDVGDYIDYHPDSKFAAVQKLTSGINARRARIGFTGKFAGDWDYTLIADFGGTTDAGGASSIENAYITYNGLKKGPLPVAFDLGYQDTSFTLDEATGSNNIMFVERPSIQTVATGIFAGDNRSAFGVRSNNDRYWAGIYLTGPTSGASHTAGEPIGAFGRATYQVVSAPDYSLHLGADIGGLLKPPGATRSITLSDRPELRVDPTAILSTGALGTTANPVNNAAVYGVEGAAGWNNFFVQGEYYHIDVDRQGLPTNGFDGGYVEGSWTITGEHRKYSAGSGAYGGIAPAYPFSPWDGQYGIGAWELAGRYSTIDLNDKFTPGVAPGTTGAIGGGRQTVYAVGVNWYPNANIRFLFDYLHGSIDKRFSTAAGGGVPGTALGTPVGGDFDAVVMRTQFAF
jgi:phosphate-selective porin OprO and OprP